MGTCAARIIWATSRGNATDSHGRRIRTDQDRFQLQWRHNAGDFLNQFNISFDKATQDTPSVEPGRNWSS